MLENTVDLEDSWMLHPFYVENFVCFLFLYSNLIIIAYD